MAIEHYVSQFLTRPWQRPKTNMLVYYDFVSLIRFGGQFDYAACCIGSARSNSAGETYPIAECMRC
jgi:hypothetical protein